MRSIFLLTIFIFFSTSLFFELQARPSFIKDQCKKVQNTADILTCVKKQNEDASKHLNGFFEFIVNKDPEKDFTEFRLAQKNWILYRDQECKWETQQEENEALKRIKELSCLTKITNSRIELLEPLITQMEETPEEEFGTFPRWLNVLGEENPEVFWNYAAHIKADLNGDDREEYIITGLTIGTKEAPKSVAVLALIDTPESGKPHITYFEFNLVPPVKEAPEEGGTSEDQEKVLQSLSSCGARLKLSLIKEDLSPTTVFKTEGTKRNEEGLQEDSPPLSRQILHVAHGVSPITIIRWNGKSYEKNDLYREN